MRFKRPYKGKRASRKERYDLLAMKTLVTRLIHQMNSIDVNLKRINQKDYWSIEDREVLMRYELDLIQLGFKFKEGNENE